MAPDAGPYAGSDAFLAEIGFAFLKARNFYYFCRPILQTSL